MPLLTPVIASLSTSQTSTARRARLAARVTAAWVTAAGVCVIAAASTALAQGAPTQLPGLIVTTPPPAAPSGPVTVTVPPPPPSGPVTVPAPPPAAARPTAAVAPQAAPAPAAKPKPKPATTAAAPRAPIGAETEGAGGAPPVGRAVLFVNDQPITGYQLESRSRLLLLGSSSIGERASAAMKRLAQSEETANRWRKIVEETVRQNQDKSKPEIIAILERKKAEIGESLKAQAISSARSSVLPELRKQAREDLIEEQLKLQEAKRLNITVEDKDVDQIMQGLAQRNNMTVAQFSNHLKSIGAEPAAMRERFKATLAWNEVVRRTFGNEVSVSERDVEKFVTQGTSGEDQVEVRLVRLLLPLPAKVDQRTIAEKYQAAERAREGKPGCKGLIAEAVRLSGKFEDLGGRNPSQYADPVRTWLMNAADNEVLPPNVTPDGVELLAVCKRIVVKADDQKRNAAFADLRQGAFEVRARGLLQDLRSRAEIVDSNRQALR